MKNKNLFIGIGVAVVLGLIYYKRYYRYDKMKKETMKNIELENKSRI